MVGCLLFSCYFVKLLLSFHSFSTVHGISWLLTFFMSVYSIMIFYIFIFYLYYFYLYHQIPPYFSCQLDAVGVHVVVAVSVVCYWGLMAIGYVVESQLFFTIKTFE